MIKAIDDATRTPSMIPGASDGRTTLPHRCTGESPMVRDISSRTAGMERIVVAAFSKMGHETMSATTATPLISDGPSSRTATGTSAAPGIAAAKSMEGVRARSTRRDAPIATPTAAPITVARVSPSTYVPSVWVIAGANKPSPCSRAMASRFSRWGKGQRRIGRAGLPHDQKGGYG